MDWIELFMEYTEGTPSPPLLRLWSGITAVSGALERRVWTKTGHSVLYPNLFTLLVAPPAIGKSIAITPVAELWYATKKLHVAPDNVTKAALIDAISAADTKKVTASGLIEYHSLVVPSSEFGVLVPAHDLEFLSVLNHIYDNPRCYRENRRTNNQRIEITNPQLTILAGTQPGFLANLLPEEAWTMGFTSRIIMVYAGTPVRVKLFDDQRQHKDDLWKQLVTTLTSFHSLMGCVLWEQPAKDELERWNAEGLPPIPEHSKLVNYNGRRILHIIKLCMISAVSRTQTLTISLDDLNRARDWLLQVEDAMPDVFREMTQKSDAQVIADMHFFAWKLWIKAKQPVHKTRLVHFLSSRVPSEKIDRVIDVAERSNIITRMAGTELFIPKPAHEHGIE